MLVVEVGQGLGVGSAHLLERKVAEDPHGYWLMSMAWLTGKLDKPVGDAVFF
jgi:hypothetical protein